MRTIVLDIGGTAIKSGIYQDGTLDDVRETPTEASLGGQHVVRLAKEIIRSYQDTCSFQQIGISTAGQVDPIEGRIIFANSNLPGYTGMEMKAEMEQTFHLPARVENDVNAAALGEAFFGAGKGVSDFICLTYGTGVGGALFFQGSLYYGSAFLAGEFGGIVTHPDERRPEEDLLSGCYERYASVTALVSRAKEIDPTLCNGRAIFARSEEPQVQKLIEDWILEVALGLTTAIHMTNPSRVILGGGIMEQKCVLERLRNLLDLHLLPTFRQVEIRCAELGNRAGMFGAACLFEENLRHPLP